MGREMNEHWNSNLKVLTKESPEFEDIIDEVLIDNKVDVYTLDNPKDAALEHVLSSAVWQKQHPLVLLGFIFCCMFLYKLLRSQGCRKGDPYQRLLWEQSLSCVP